MTKCKKKSTEINPQSILMNLFFQRGGRWRWKERRRKYEEPVQRHITGCVWQGHKGCLWCLGLSGALPGGGGGGHLCPASQHQQEEQTACAPGHPSAERPLHAQRAGTVVEFMLYRYSFPPSALPAPRGLGNQGQAAPRSFVILWPWPRTVTFSQYDPNESLPFLYIQTFLFSGYPPKYHLGLGVHSPSSSILTCDT